MSTNRLKVCVAYEFDARNLQVQSGFPYFMLKQLEKRCGSVVDAFPLPLPHTPRTLARTVLYRALGKSYGREREPALLRGIAAKVERKIRQNNPDVVVCPSSIPVTFLQTERPIVVCADAVFGQMLGYYFHDAATCYRDAGFAQEGQALSNASLAVFSSDWAAKGAIALHGASSAKVSVIPFGANLADPPSDEDVADAIATRASDACRLVFIGRDWHRKGGDIVLETVRLLRRSGMRVELTIIGCVPPERCEDFATVIPALDRADPSQDAKFRSIMMSAHFVFVPSRAEAYGLTFCEACAFAAPAITSAQGGIPTIVRDGETGICLPETASAQDFCNIIETVFSEPGRYRDMARAARQDFRDRLNWDAFGKAFVELIA